MLTETENKDEPILPSKRELDPLPASEDKEDENQPNKSQKLPSLTHGDTVALKEEKVTPSVNSGSNFSTAEGKSVNEAEPGKNANGVLDEQEEEEEEDDDADFEDEEEEENEKAASADRKGKGIMIEEESDDSDSDYSSDGNDSGDDELEDDPLAEVDLDNILPSRTRRRAAQPGVRIANEEHYG